MRALEEFQNRPGRIRAAVVHHNDFVRDIMKPQFRVKMLNGRCDAAFFVAGSESRTEQL